MSAQGAKGPTEEDWLVQKPTLKKFWLDGRKKLLGENGVVETMKARYNFSASKWQYEQHFRDWHWNRYRKKEDWEQLAAAIYERKRQGKESDVFIGGELQSRDKIRKEISRYHPSIHHHLFFASTQQLPKSFAIRTPTSDRTVSLTIDLPFHNFERHLRLRNNGPGHQNWSWPNVPAGPSTINPRLTLCDEADAEDLYLNGSLGSIEEIETLERKPSFEASSTIHTASDLWTSDSSVLTALKSVVPRSIAEKDNPGSSVVSSSTQIFTSSLHRQMLFSVANNFVGLDSFPVEDIIYFLQKGTNVNLYQLICSDRSYSSRMIVQNIFKAAIEVGDARIVDVLVRENPKDIKVNEQFWSVESRTYTPIERASVLRYEDVVKVLLEHGADVMRTYPKNYGEFNIGRALDYAVESIDAGGFVKFDLHPRIFCRLLEAGGDLSYQPMSGLVQRGEGKLVVSLMSANARKNAAEWSEWGIFGEAMMFLDEHTSMEIVKIMLKYGIDLNYHVERNIRIHRVIDFASQRGRLRLVTLLLESGALLTGDTLPCAIASGNQDLILLLLARGADVNSIGSLRVTPLAAAIRLQDAQVLKLVEERGASIMQGQEHLIAALEAASEVGNIQYMERLIQHEGKASPSLLGYALLLAIRAGRDELAKNLIDAGADVNVKSRGPSNGDGPPLLEALKRHQEALVLSLLDADANPNLEEIGGRTPPIALAVEWGNRSVIENLIFAGADVNAYMTTFNPGRVTETALMVAMKRQDRELIQLLLAFGADLNYHEYDYGTALQAAAEDGDIELVGFLLDQGADPKDLPALTAALESEKLFDLLFERYCARYLIHLGDFGARILAEVIGKRNERVIRLMLERRVNTKIMINLEGQTATPFGHAIARQQVDLEQFLQNGCNPNDVVSEVPWENFDASLPRIIKRRGGYDSYASLRVTALLAAIGTRNTSTVELFIRYGADVNFPARGLVKRTPLQRAAEIGSLEIVELLVNHGANVNAPAAERGGGTALQLAAIGGYIPLACRLLSLKADVNAPRSKVNGRTALEGATEHGRLDMVKLLLNGGAGSEHGGEGQIANAIALARENGHYPICDFLESHLSLRRQGSGREKLADANNGDFTDWTLDDDPFSLVNFEGAE